MCLQNKLVLKNINIQTLEADWVPQNVGIDVLRLDGLHPVVSGNKYFKLKYYLLGALQTGSHTVATFGGAYSNHIVAAAFACREYGLNSIGIIRGEKPAKLSHTLTQAENYGMQLQFISRAAFKNRQDISEAGNGVYIIPEGGYGPLGAKGAAEILNWVPDSQVYTHIVCALGTGTMFAGLVNGSKLHQTVIGISVLKNNFSIADEVRLLINNDVTHGPYQIVQGYHFGGYAKHPIALTAFMNDLWAAHSLPTDIVYTSKAFFGLRQMVIEKLIDDGSRVLFVHSGGLQGNASLPSGVLSF